MSFKISCLVASAVLILAGCSNMGMHCPMSSMHGEDKEVTMSIQEVPAPVAATINSEAKGMKIDEIAKETEDGKILYEVKMGESELKIDAAGKVIERENGKEEMGEKHEMKGGCKMCKEKGEMCEKCKAMKAEEEKEDKDEGKEEAGKD